MTRKEFVVKHANVVRKITKGTGVFPETLFAQAIIESQGPNAKGVYEPGGSTLSKRDNNYFGIKADSSWKGKKSYYPTVEYLPEYTVVNAPFRSYNSFEESARDYIKFLHENSRYKWAIGAKNYKSQIEMLKAAGYATGPQYVPLVTGVANEVAGYLKNIPVAPVLFMSTGKIPIVVGSIIFAGLVGFGTYWYLNKK